MTNANLTEVERAVLLLGVNGCRLAGEFDESPDDEDESEAAFQARVAQMFPAVAS